MTTANDVAAAQRPPELLGQTGGGHRRQRRDRARGRTGRTGRGSRRRPHRAQARAPRGRRARAGRTEQPIGRVVGPADVARLAVHLMVNTALTGATYDVDGGQQLVAP